MKFMIYFKRKTIGVLLIAFLLLVTLTVNDPNEVRAASLGQEEPVYIVQSGDTLNSIALRFGISAEDIQSANGISDPNSLDIGQRLVIPGLPEISGVLTSETLSFGASLAGLTREYGLNQQDLVFLNRLTSPSETIAGISFIIPINESQPPLSPLTSLNEDATLLETAIRSGTSHWRLVEDNQLAGSWDILTGETLYASGEIVTNASVLPTTTQISLNELPVIQGETLEIGITTAIPAEFSGTFNGEGLKFFSEDGETFYSFHGIHALAEPGVFPLQITADYEDGSFRTYHQLVLLSAGGYGSEWINVPDDYLDQEAIEQEDAYLKPILNQATPERHWENRFQYPIDEPCVNGLFGQRRDYNNGGLYFYHTGLDFAVCAPNLNIYAPAAGEVVMAEELFVKGKAILIDHGWGVFSGYWHLSEFSVTVGDFVEPGDLLGQIGNTGRSAGPHLHFEIDISGTPVNPQTWLEQEFPQTAP